MTNLDSLLRSRDITLPTNICLIKTMVFPVSVFECKNCAIKKLSTEGLMLLNCRVETLESRLDCKEIQPVHAKGNQS